MMEQKNVILSAKDVEIQFSLRGKKLNAIRKCSLDLYEGETLAIVGESGSGKSVFTKSFVGMLDANGSITGGEIMFEGKDIAKYTKEKEWLTIRGKKIAMVMQDPMTSLNPLKKIGKQIQESIELHQGIKGEAAKKMALEMLEKVGIPNPEKRYNQYPHEFSGGMRQRAMIAMAMSCSPKVLIADEPTTALDVTIQAQIFELMEKLKREHDTAIMLITHDMGVVSELADDVAVMYMGSIVERGSVREVLKYPAHPYTAALLRSIPILHKGRGQRLEPIRGSTPDPYDRPKGCQFAPRCDFCCEKCRQEMPSEVPVCDGHAVRCWNAEQVYAGHREEVEAV